MQYHIPARAGSSSQHSSSSLASTANASASPTSTNASHGPPAAASSSELSPHKSMSGYNVPSGVENISVGVRGGAVQCDMGAKRQQSMRVKEGVSALLMHICCSDVIHSTVLSMAVYVYFMIRLPTFASLCEQRRLAQLRLACWLHSLVSC